jgi:CheY-like chemotaxis protein/ketosteroid isomerase-like protein
MDIARFAPPRILLVENDPSLVSLVSEVLDIGGYSVSVAASLEAIPAQLEQETFALVLADVYVGRFQAGSFTPAHRLRRQVSPTPIGLLMTLPFTPEEARRAGFAFVVPMPFSLDDLLAHVATTLQSTLGTQDQQRVAVAERYFAACEQEDWQAMLDLCTEDVIYYPPTASGIHLASRRQGQATLRASLALAAQAMSAQTFLHCYYAAVPNGLVVRYLRCWTTPEGERQCETEVAFFHFRGEQISQIGTRPQLAALSAHRQTG